MGTVWSAYQQTFPPKPKWAVDNVPDQSGKVIFLTGGNSGLGFETARVLLSRNAKVYITSRDHDKGLAAVEKLRSLSGKQDIHLVECDFSDLHSIKKAAEEFISQESHLNVLYNNAGVMFPPIDQLTVQGFDLQFGVNVIGHAYLTQLLLPTLQETAKAQNVKVRVVNIGSSAILLAPKGGVDFATLTDSPARRRFDPVKLYQQAKAGSVIYSNELTRRYADKGIISVSLNPGNTRTGIQRYVTGLQAKILSTILYNIDYGVLTHLYAGTAPEVDNLNGKYFIPFARVGSSRADLQDPAMGDRLWKWLEDQTRDP